MKIKVIFIGVMLVALLAVPALAVNMVAPTIDGNVADWGLGKLNTDSWSLAQTWTPYDGVVFTVEDNHNPNHAGYPLNFYGVHISGNGHTFIPYDEPKVLLADYKPDYWVSPPYGNEPYDLEAMYFYQDMDYLYFAIITSEPANALSDRMPGDLAFNLDQNSQTGELGYEYGVRLGNTGWKGFQQGDIVTMPDWQVDSVVTPEGPDLIIGGQKTGTAVVQYSNSLPDDNGDKNYVIEIKIAKSDLGLSSGTTVNFGSILMPENCMNDHVYVPEFPTVAVSAGSIIGITAIVYSLRNRRKEE